MDEYKQIVVDGVKYYGKHLILSAKSCDDKIISKTAIAIFLKLLVQEIDMLPYGEPIVERFGKGIETGISAIQLIETSAITMHTNDIAHDLYMDVFSCKGFNEIRVIELLRKAFQPSEINYHVMFRH